jgi:hypothetical protein
MLALASNPITSAVPWLDNQAASGPEPQPTSSTRLPATSGSMEMIAGRSYSELYGLSPSATA